MTESILAFILGLSGGLSLGLLHKEWAKFRKVSSLTMSTDTIPRRYGAAIQLKPEYYDRYKKLHAAVWEDVLLRMSRSNIRNFTIYYHKETSTMFQHFEWIGHMTSKKTNLTREEIESLFQDDMRAIADDPITKVWWAECEPCQEPFAQWNRGFPPPSQQQNKDQATGGDWWAPLECLNQCGHWPIEYSSQLRYPKHEDRFPDGSCQ